MDQHPDAGDKEQPDGGERVEEETEIDVESGGRAVFLEKTEMRIAGTEPGVDDLFEGLAGAMREMRVLEDGNAGENECDDDRADADRVDRGLLQAASKEKHHRGPEGREERDEVDVVKKHRSQFSVLAFSVLVLRSTENSQLGAENCFPTTSSNQSRPR